MLPKFPSQEIKEATKSDVLPKIRDEGSKFSIRAMFRGVSAGVERKRKASGDIDASMSARPAHKKPRFAVEVYIAVARTMREEMAKAQSFEDVVSRMMVSASQRFDEGEPIFVLKITRLMQTRYEDVFDGDLSDLTDSDSEPEPEPESEAGPESSDGHEEPANACPDFRVS